ncbi:PREDICTED: putative tRNA pseudouridine synthase Pus10 isoform X3 [Acropora digitifera]|uniref:putative tRNA pseudouridine synthase Pus10 isoform X3 n=1 Tax=Acropora digitifera TaxID=70779 RepID=UPI00077A4BE3|nr:PREDICTED: putative tRNA pseudouridine synthase Pus10 isoform X3 [Acropora digitifera]
MADVTEPGELPCDFVTKVLKDLPCCPRCILRFIGEKDISQYQSNKIEEDDRGPCVACLGILAKDQESSFVSKIQSAIHNAGYQFDDFTFAVSLPLSILLRQFSMSLFLQENYSSKYDKKKLDQNPSVKDVVKWVYGPMIEELLQVSYKPLSPFKISLTFTHNESCKELQFLEPSKSRSRRQKRQRVEETVTTATVRKGLAEFGTVNQLERQADCPPKSPQSPSFLAEVICSHESIYIAGRYNKFSRILSQTPWIIDNVRLSESSVEEKICNPIRGKILADEHKFASAGREDIDVCMLGGGRPFLIEFINPRVTRFNESFFADIQHEINSSTSDISVRDLQQVTKALIWTEKTITDELVRKLNNTKDLVISQKTPLRVLHRRSLAVRERCIYNMKVTEQIDSNHISLLLKTQAGTYIKEFAHGDFGRTKPNLGDLLNTETDILQLDVESVDVDWPPRKVRDSDRDVE